jgi:uncharacterized protein YndB with AHSA1/START domain
MNAPAIDASVHLSLTRIFDVPPEVLFDAWFTREQWQAWIGPEGCRCDVPLLEPYPGGRYRIDMNLSDGSSLPVEGVFRVVDRPHSLSFTWNWVLAQGTLVRLSFLAVANGTELTLIHEGLPSEAVRDDHDKGWNSVLNNKLARYLKGETP